ncbi:SRPBCC family protein [Streptomyces neyagawaensis]|uniref:SRPBCC family protein n=1 Tax=Streptomyces neyagawaensis TaxID=42238 RepID=UPI00201D296A|nr:SRPBCC family protein [Streptomyces neyagawaensis]MCL6737663.1 SRPBCC family protein [Streptomyces neyagawaensis]MDE1687653.1 SRPBCC family protein [Streptomyces neyagawaensis]
MNKYVVSETAVIDAPVTRVWDVIARTDRYAEWVAGAIEVTDHHGVATIGKTYSERNRTLGPLKTDSVWTVEEIVPLKRRVDTGVGFAPLQDITNIFEFRPVQTADGQEATEMLYQVEYSIGLGPLGQLLDSVQQPAMRAGMRTSMANLNTLLRSEASRTAR